MYEHVQVLKQYLKTSCLGPGLFVTEPPSNSDGKRGAKHLLHPVGAALGLLNGFFDELGPHGTVRLIIGLP